LGRPENLRRCTTKSVTAKQQRHNNDAGAWPTQRAPQARLDRARWFCTPTTTQRHIKSATALTFTGDWVAPLRGEVPCRSLEVSFVCCLVGCHVGCTSLGLSVVSQSSTQIILTGSCACCPREKRTPKRASAQRIYSLTYSRQELHGHHCAVKGQQTAAAFPKRLFVQEV